MMLGDVTKPSWSSLVTKLKSTKPSKYEVIDVLDSKGIQKCKDTLGKFNSSKKGLSIIIIHH